MTDTELANLNAAADLDATGTLKRILLQQAELRASLYVLPTLDAALSREQARRHWEAYSAIAGPPPVRR